MERLRFWVIGISIVMLLGTVALVWQNYRALATSPPLLGVPVYVVLIPLEIGIIASVFRFLGRRSMKLYFTLCTACAIISWWFSMQHLLALEYFPTLFSVPICHVGLIGFLFMLWLGIEYHLVTHNAAVSPQELIISTGQCRRRAALVVLLMFLFVVTLAPSVYNDITDSGTIVSTKYGVRVIRTPADRFEELNDYPFAPNYVDVYGMRMHYVDEGPKDGQVVLLLHGVPAWSYVYRNMIPPLTEAGYRVVAPDYLGFGKSDKPISASDYSLRRHTDWMFEFIQKLQLSDITMFQHDWGGHVGMRLVAEHPKLFARVMSSNGYWILASDHRQPWKLYATQRLDHFSPWLEVSKLIQSETTRALSSEELYAYDAPFPTNRYKAGVRITPFLVPTTCFDPAHMYQLKARELIGTFDKPFLTAFADNDPLTRGNDTKIHQNVPGTKGQKHTTLKGKHLIQEDSGSNLAQILVQFIQDNPLDSQHLSQVAGNRLPQVHTRGMTPAAHGFVPID